MSDLIARRAAALGPAYRLLYDNPVHFVRGRGVHLYDPDGVEYLDAYNNVPCIGHSHPAVAAAVSTQLGLINTNTRYLHDSVVEYAEELLATFPAELSNVMFTCTGSETNDLALRVAQFTTGHRGIIVTDNAYHGTTQAVAAISPSLGPGVPRPPHVRHIPAPDAYRTGLSDAELTEFMVCHVRDAVKSLEASGYGVSALVLDSIFSSDGILPGPLTWMERAAAIVRQAGGLLIGDEVQSGFGRLGTGMWGFSRHRVIPDVVTMGKSMGNGYPVAAAVFRPELLCEFGPQVRYFNTFGGSTAAIAAATAVLHTIKQEQLIDHAHTVGKLLGQGLRQLCTTSPHIGCVRGIGLAHGVVVVSENGHPDPARATRIVNAMRARRILISASGADGSNLKIRPPLVFGGDDVDRLITTLQEVLENE